MRRFIMNCCEYFTNANLFSRVILFPCRECLYNKPLLGSPGPIITCNRCQQVKVSLHCMYVVISLHISYRMCAISRYLDAFVNVPDPQSYQGYVGQPMAPMTTMFLPPSAVPGRGNHQIIIGQQQMQVQQSQPNVVRI